MYNPLDDLPSQFHVRTPGSPAPTHYSIVTANSTPSPRHHQQYIYIYTYVCRCVCVCMYTYMHKETADAYVDKSLRCFLPRDDACQGRYGLLPVGAIELLIRA